MVAALAASLCSGCGRHAAPEPPERAVVQLQLAQRWPSSDAALEGLSALGRDAEGRLWAVPERQDHLVQLQVRDGRLEGRRLPLRGKPAGLDAEGLALWGDGQFALGTEGHGGERDADLVLLGHCTENEAVVDSAVELPYRLWAMRGASNRGIEGVCWAGQLWVAAETAGGDARGRWAPLARRGTDGGWSAARLRLTSQSGKISALACQKRPDGASELWAIERHYNTSRWLRAVVPAELPADVTAEVYADLARPFAAAGSEVPNLEGIATDPHDPAAAWLISDNSQGGARVGPALLLQVRPSR